MHAEQLKSVLQGFKVKVAEMNLDHMIEALDAVFAAEESVRAAVRQRDMVKSECDSLQARVDVLKAEEAKLKSSLDSMRASAREWVSGLK